MGETRRRSDTRASGILPAVLLLAALVPALAAAQQRDSACPPGLLDAALRHGGSLREAQEAVRASTESAPLGIEPTMQFDRAAHACHSGPAQTFREFGEPVCLADRPDGRVLVTYPFRLFFRQAPSLGDLFDKDWEWSSDGWLEVEFRAGDGGWVVVGQRERLDLFKETPGGSAPRDPEPGHP